MIENSRAISWLTFLLRRLCNHFHSCRFFFYLDDKRHLFNIYKNWYSVFSCLFGPKPIFPFPSPLCSSKNQKLSFLVPFNTLKNKTNKISGRNFISFTTLFFLMFIIKINELNNNRKKKALQHHFLTTEQQNLKNHSHLKTVRL